MTALLLLDCGALRAQTPQTQKTSQSSPSDLTPVSIEILMNLEVISVSKRQKKSLRDQSGNHAKSKIENQLKAARSCEERNQRPGR